jgi:single-strand DNA-binding protein
MSTQVNLVGNIGGDPELRFTASGKAVASFSMVTSKPVKQDDGKWEDTEVTWWRVTAWDRLAENVAESLQKGDTVMVSGKTYMEQYEKKDGTTGQSLKVNAWNIGPDLKRNAAKVTRNERKTAAEVHQASDPWSSAPAVSEDPWPEPPF